MDVLDETFVDRGVGFGKDPVSEIEYVSTTPATPQNVVGLRLRCLPSREANNGIEVALKRNPVAGPAACFVEGYAPVDADDIRSARRHMRQQFTGSDSKGDPRNRQVLEPRRILST